MRSHTHTSYARVVVEPMNTRNARENWQWAHQEQQRDQEQQRNHEKQYGRQGGHGGRHGGGHGVYGDDGSSGGGRIGGDGGSGGSEEDSGDDGYETDEEERELLAAMDSLHARQPQQWVDGSLEPSAIAHRNTVTPRHASTSPTRGFRRASSA
jgi:hypothetical protein